MKNDKALDLADVLMQECMKSATPSDAMKAAIFLVAEIFDLQVPHNLREKALEDLLKDLRRVIEHQPQQTSEGEVLQ